VYYVRGPRHIIFLIYGTVFGLVGLIGLAALANGHAVDGLLGLLVGGGVSVLCLRAATRAWADHRGRRRSEERRNKEAQALSEAAMDFRDRRTEETASTIGRLLGTSAEQVTRMAQSIDEERVRDARRVCTICHKEPVAEYKKIGVWGYCPECYVKRLLQCITCEKLGVAEFAIPATVAGRRRWTTYCPTCYGKRVHGQECALKKSDGPEAFIAALSYDRW
jgi:hypothetical protein